MTILANEPRHVFRPCLHERRPFSTEGPTSHSLVRVKQVQHMEPSRHRRIFGWRAVPEVFAVKML